MVKKKTKKTFIQKAKKVALIILCIFLGLMLFGFIYENISEFIDSKTLTPPGRIVDVNGHKMHIYCTGESQDNSPTVILEAGGGYNYTTWARVQPEIARYTKVCSYDRAGLGFSENANDKRTNSEVVSQLEILLNNANINGPYIMTGHSLGGFYTRLFTKRNPEKVVGLIQVDPTVDEQAKLESADTTPQYIYSITNTMFYLSYKLGIARLVVNVAPDLIAVDISQKQKGIAFMLPLFGGKINDGEGLFNNMDEMKTASNFGELPVTILSADKSIEEGISQFGEDVKNWHPSLAKRLSNNSNCLLVKNSSHFIQYDQPQVVIDSILALLPN